MNGWTEPMVTERGMQKDIPEENWLGLTIDVGASKDTDRCGQ